MCFHSLHDIGSIIYQARTHKCQTSLSIATMSALDWRQRLLMGHQDANDHYVALGMLYEARQAGQLLGIQLGEGNFKGDGKGKGVLETRARTNGNIGDAIFGSSEDQPEVEGNWKGCEKRQQMQSRMVKGKAKGDHKESAVPKGKGFGESKCNANKCKGKSKGTSMGEHSRIQVEATLEIVWHVSKLPGRTPRT